MRKTKIIIATVVAALCAAVVAACGSSSNDNTTTTSKSGGAAKPAGGTISLLVPEYSDNTKGFWQDLITRFEAANPGDKVNLQTISWTDINQKITTLVSTNQQPDILNIDAYANFAGDDLLLPASDVLSPDIQQDFLPQFAQNGQYKGTQYGVPFIGSVRGLFYNKKIFKKAGITDPPKNWDELRA